MDSNTLEARLAQAKLTLAATLSEISTLTAVASHNPDELRYQPAGDYVADHRFGVRDLTVDRLFDGDPSFVNATRSPTPFVELQVLSTSPDWQDRIRAAAAQTWLRDSITMPDGFSCIYEPATSPSQRGYKYPRDMVWLASPDENMLHELLPLYRELWASYESQWRSTPERTYEVGRLDGVAPSRVYRPGTTVEQVIGDTMLTHDGMYRHAPEHLRRMHPLHEQYQAAR